ncbi:MAG: hypothetical protein PHS09_04745 [Candidatus Omnitrophica bacterium]|nr:hypothetical protein [Candidatus Omnitrophota bacterium]
MVQEQGKASVVDSLEEAVGADIEIVFMLRVFRDGCVRKKACRRSADMSVPYPGRKS